MSVFKNIPGAKRAKRVAGRGARYVGRELREEVVEPVARGTTSPLIRAAKKLDRRLFPSEGFRSNLRKLRKEIKRGQRR